MLSGRRRPRCVGGDKPHVQEAAGISDGALRHMTILRVGASQPGSSLHWRITQTNSWGCILKPVLLATTPAIPDKTYTQVGLIREERDQNSRNLVPASAAGYSGVGAFAALGSHRLRVMQQAGTISISGRQLLSEAHIWWQVTPLLRLLQEYGSWSWGSREFCKVTTV